MFSEIGSEFWKADIIDNQVRTFDNYHRYLLTGRTALDYIIKDIKASRPFNIIYMPSYCCHTMIKPFIENNVAVIFYDVSFIEGQYTYNVDFDIKCDAILIMHYFGFYNQKVPEIIAGFKDKDKLIIEDATHSWFQKEPYSIESDYVFASFRKWTGLPCGAIVIKKDCEFTIPINLYNDKYIELRKQAAKLKREYVEKAIGEKSNYLEAFSYAEEYLEQDYMYYGIPHEIKEIIDRIDYKKITGKRIKNAHYLVNGLRNINKIDTITMSDEDTPIFVPIIIKDGTRDELRKYLISKSIYCPVHWPLTDEHKIDNTFLYDNGLSLVCDQRYNITDMKRILQRIGEFFGEYIVEC